MANTSMFADVSMIRTRCGSRARRGNFEPLCGTNVSLNRPSPGLACLDARPGSRKTDRGVIEQDGEMGWNLGHWREHQSISEARATHRPGCIVKPVAKDDARGQSRLNYLFDAGSDRPDRGEAPSRFS
jgi:hypothetical protein